MKRVRQFFYSLDMFMQGFEFMRAWRFYIYRKADGSKQETEGWCFTQSFRWAERQHA